MSEELEVFGHVAGLLRASALRATGAGASDRDVAAIAEAFGHELPQSYAAFLRDFGWGGVSDLEILGAGVDVPPFLDVRAVLQFEREEARPQLATNLLPIQRDGGGNLYCIRDNGPSVCPDVVFWDHELESEQTPEVVASHFAGWLLEQLQSL